MSDRISKLPAQHSSEPSRSTSPPKGGDRLHADRCTDATTHQLGHPGRDTFCSTRTTYKVGQAHGSNRLQKDKKIEAPQAATRTVRQKRSRPPQNSIARPLENKTTTTSAEIKEGPKCTKETNKKESVKIQEKLQNKLDDFLKVNPDKKIESWEHYPLTEILETGNGPYSPNRPLLWTSSRRGFAHFEKHLKKTSFSDPEEYTEYAALVLSRPISSACPAFFSMEVTSKDMKRDKEKNPPLVTKVYRFDKEKELVVIGDAKGQILTCFPVEYNRQNQSKYEWFKEDLLRRTERIDSNRNELATRSERQTRL